MTQRRSFDYCGFHVQLIALLGQANTHGALSVSGLQEDPTVNTENSFTVISHQVNRTRFTLQKEVGKIFFAYWNGFIMPFFSLMLACAAANLATGTL